jgi:hypothetical protein
VARVVSRKVGDWFFPENTAIVKMIDLEILMDLQVLSPTD